MAEKPEKFDAVKEFTNIRDTLSRAVEQSVKGAAGTLHPLLDAYETADSVVIRTEPIDGIQPESLEVSMEDGLLVITGTTAADPDTPAGARYLVNERRFGTFTRSVRITAKVDADAAQATISRGSLTVTLPKIADTRPQVIDVTPAE